MILNVYEEEMSLKKLNSSFTCLVKDFSLFLNKDYKPPNQVAINLKMLGNKTVINYIIGEKESSLFHLSVHTVLSFVDILI